MHLKLGQVSAMVVSSPKMAREVLKANDLAISGIPGLLGDETRTTLERVHKEKDKIMEAIIQEHREKQKSIAKGGDIKPGEKLDLADVLLQLQQSDTLEFPISNDNIKAAIWVRTHINEKFSLSSFFLLI
ncbi:LOW QUALITY PROTEIN: Cytochrome P [Parasponia andersonii]|uniref:Cytochrome P n=1 Tax=Parasponia andersonii TaxID=3476 RepID=A0A2P5ABV6_PARAD|nr:LOW QUALITY PROTEIN: Cytochrome P [Parasponia andersonii]